jgi:hypothetical protein
MNFKAVLRLAALVTLLSAGCSSLPGLRVLTGEDTGEDTVSRAVEALDLVMADKTGATDPSLLAAADRIEQATGNVDIIEIRPDPDTDTFLIDMLYVPPNVPQTLEGQIMSLDDRRRAFELTWQAVLPESEGSDNILINLLYPQPVTTLDSGSSFVGYIIANAEITRADAATYLAGERNLQNFYTMIVDGTLNYSNPDEISLYEGHPNHPMFILQQLQQQQTTSS